MSSRAKRASERDLPQTFIDETIRDVLEPLEEKLRMGVSRSSRSDLVQYLLCMEPWVAHADHLVWNRPHHESLQAERRQQKSFWIRRDLRRLGVQQGLELSEPLVITSDEQLVGLGYVLEGVVLRGRTLRKRFAGDSHGPFLFLEGYGGDTRLMWNHFLTYLEEHLHDDAERRAAAKTARSALLHLTTWLESLGTIK